jgi:hypothetical protein
VNKLTFFFNYLCTPAAERRGLACRRYEKKKDVEQARRGEKRAKLLSGLGRANISADGEKSRV